MASNPPESGATQLESAAFAPDSFRNVREFVEGFCVWQGCSLERQKELTRIRLSPELQTLFGKEEMLLGFGVGRSDPQVEPIAPGSYVLETIFRFMKERGRRLRLRLPVRVRLRKRNALAQVQTRNAEISAIETERVYRRENIFHLRLIYLSDERQEDLLSIAVDENDVARPVDPWVWLDPDAQLLRRRHASLDVLQQHFDAALRVAARSARDHAAEIADAIHERLHRTVIRLKSYYLDRLREVPRGDPARWRDATEQVDDEYANKLAEEIENHHQRVVIRLISCAEIEIPFAQVRLRLVGEGGDGVGAEHVFQQNLANGAIEPGSCASCRMPTLELHLCSSGHVVCATCARICGACGASSCIACGVQTCAVCGVDTCSACQSPCDDCHGAICPEHGLLCSRCQRRSCTSCGALCVRCNAALCARDRRTCVECDHAVCHSCSVDCARCHSATCAGESEDCEHCGRAHCPNCLASCELCGARTCLFHSAECQTCGKMACAEHMRECATCESAHCLNDIDQCTVCSRSVCAKCARTCASCAKVTCSHHGVRCSVCQGSACSDHASTCETCGQAVCAAHARRCAPCGSMVCDSHALRCSSCGEHYCNRCVPERGLCSLCQRLARTATVGRAAVAEYLPAGIPEDLQKVRRWRVVAIRDRHLLLAMDAPRELLVLDAEKTLRSRRAISPALRLRRG